tara:strand:+ start:3512 stop:3946 length:435 start_codon:yes stop_codon:yes gene_type:complete
MQYNLKDIVLQAVEDPKTIKNVLPKGMSVIGRGCKIQQFDDKTEILNLGKGGDYFKECTSHEYDMFFEHGWLIGSKLVQINNTLHKLNIIEDRIKTEMNTRKNDKHIQNLKSRRESLLNKYTNYKQELNSIKSKQNGKSLPEAE